MSDQNHPLLAKEFAPVQTAMLAALIEGDRDLLQLTDAIGKDASNSKDLDAVRRGSMALSTKLKAEHGYEIVVDGTGRKAMRCLKALTPATAAAQETDLDGEIPELHELAEMLPKYQDHEYEALKLSVQANGLRHPIILWQGKVIDGRHRQKACLEMGVTPRYVAMHFETFEAAVEYIWDENITRRHLTFEQQVAAAYRLAGLSKGANQHSEGSSQELSSKLTGVSVSSLKRAKVVFNKGVESVQTAFMDGKIDLSRAERIARQEPERQTRTLKAEIERKAPPSGTGGAYKARGEAGDGTDFHPTHPAMARLLLAHVAFPEDAVIADFQAGQGHLLAPFVETGFETLAFDIEDRGLEGCRQADFLAMTKPDYEALGRPVIVANPPFNEARAHIEKALSFEPALLAVHWTLDSLSTPANLPTYQHRALAEIIVPSPRMPRMNRPGYEGLEAAAQRDFIWLIFTQVNLFGLPVMRVVNWKEAL